MLPGTSTDHAATYLATAVVFLLAGVLAAPICRRLKVSPVVGYLLAGLVLGPGGVKFVDDPEGVRRVAELGVIFLLFAIGLELSVERLKALRRFIFGLGAAQTVVTAGIVAAVAYSWGAEAPLALIVGVCIAFSSTAVVMQLLAERRETTTPAGRIAFSILLFQDLAVAPALLLVQVLAGSDRGGGASVPFALVQAIGTAVIVVSGIALLGRLVFQRIFRFIAAERSSELFAAAVILVALGAAWATELAGLSAALGAFLAGVLLAETEFRSQIEADIEPFKGLLLGLFFMGVGMSIEPAHAAGSPVAIASAILAIAAFKAAIIFPIARAFGRSGPESARVAGLLAQSGEFGFVVAGAATLAGVMPIGVGQSLTLVIAGSMLASPLFDVAGRAAAALLSRMDKTGGETSAATPNALIGHVIVAGYGRAGRLVGRALSTQNASWIAIDRDASEAAEARAKGDPVLFGDAARLELLERAGLEAAAALVVTLDDPVAAARTVGAVRTRRPNLPIFARARDAEAAASLSRLGAHVVVPESLESSLILAGEALSALGVAKQSLTDMLTEMRAAETPRPDEPAAPEPDPSRSA